MCGHSCSVSKSNLETTALSQCYIENLRDMSTIASDTHLCESMCSSYSAQIWRHSSTLTQSSSLFSCPLVSCITSGSTLCSSQKGSREGLSDSKLFRDQVFCRFHPEEGREQGYPYSRTVKSSPRYMDSQQHLFCPCPSANICEALASFVSGFSSLK